jgi:hypothetical protein
MIHLYQRLLYLNNRSISTIDVYQGSSVPEAMIEREFLPPPRAVLR